MKCYTFIAALLAFIALSCADAAACTGIALTSGDGSRISARTVEWAASAMDCGFCVVPRGHKFRSYTPQGQNGMEYSSIYGYVGIYTEYEDFVVEGINESGLSAGLFFFPGYGQYRSYDPSRNARSISDIQFVSWILANFSSLDVLCESLKNIDLISADSRIGTVHWRISEPGGRTVVIESVGGVPKIYENRLGVLTNAPGFEWHLSNLNNYVNLRRGNVTDNTLCDGITLKAFSGGTGMLGLPGDFTSPSRFVRAVFFQSTAPKLKTGFETVIQAFRILDNFDIPPGIQHESGQVPEGLPSATQFTSASDLKSLKLYYRTAWNSNIRCIDLMEINFSKVKYQTHPLDPVKEQPIECVRIR